MTVGSQPHLLDQPHHDGSVLYVPVQQAALGESVPVRVRVPGTRAVDTVWLRSLVDGEPRVVQAQPEPSQTGSDNDGNETWWRADLLLHNPVTSYRFLVVAKDGRLGWLNGTGSHARDVTDASDFRFSTADPVPDWVADAVVYQVFPDRFARAAAAVADPPPAPSWAIACEWDDEVVHSGSLTSRQWFGGDLTGIAEHLDHLQELGADVLYLTPVWPADSNHRYDAATFDTVDPALGGEDALAALVKAAHERGMRVLGDLTTNHTGRTHEWFTAAQADADAPEAGYYVFERHPHEYASWLDVPSLPKLNHLDTGLRARVYDGPDSVVARWLRPPVELDGWRIDVANMTGRYREVDVAHEVARTVRTTMAAAKPDAWLLAEHGHDASGDLSGDGWHGTMAYAAFTRPVWTWLNTAGHGLTYLGIGIEVPTLDGHATAATMREFTAAAPWRSRLASVNQLGSHDTPRVRTVVGANKHLVAVTMLATLPGVPMLFAGDEIGLTGRDGEHSRTPFPWHRRKDWDDTTLAAYRTLLALRRDHVALRRGGLRWAHIGSDVLVYLREHPDERLLVHVARSTHAAVELPLEALSCSAFSTLYGPEVAAQPDAHLTLTADGSCARVLRLEN